MGRFFSRVGLPSLGLLVLFSSSSIACKGSRASQSANLSLVEVTGPELRSRIEEAGAKSVVVNVWATWCPPCLEEFPELVGLGKKIKESGYDLWFVSTDFDSERPQVLEFLKKQGVEGQSFVKAGTDMAFINALDPKWSGSLPVTFLFSSEGERLATWEGKVTAEIIEAELHRQMTK